MRNLTEKLTVLRELREDAGIKQKELAKAIGYSSSTISRIERGERPLTPLIMEEILEYYKQWYKWGDDEYHKIYEELKPLTVLTIRSREGQKAIAPSIQYNWLYDSAELAKLESEVPCKDIWVISLDLSNDTGIA